MKTLKIKWQRLVSEGETCPRCSTTGGELKKAVSRLRESLSSLDVEVCFEKEELSVDEFQDDPLKSNMIFLNDKPLEDWINGEVGQSQCCDVCGPTDCRTTIVDGETYEEIPAELIIKAGLIAASNIIVNDTNESCCGSDNSETSSCC